MHTHNKTHNYKKQEERKKDLRFFVFGETKQKKEREKSVKILIIYLNGAGWIFHFNYYHHFSYSQNNFIILFFSRIFNFDF